MRPPASGPKKRGTNKPEPLPWQVVDLEDGDILALQALEKGLANAGQQQRALEVIKVKLCRYRRMSFFPGGDDGRRATDFAEGKRFIASQIDRILNMRPDHSRDGSADG